MIPASSPGLSLEDLDVEAAPLGPAHEHAQDHLRPVLGVGAAGAGVDGDERVAGVVAPGEQPLLLELGQARLDRGDLLVELGRDRGVLLGQLDQPLEVVDVALERRNTSRRRLRARVLGGYLRRAGRSRPRSPAPPISVSSAVARSLSEAGSKIVREQLQLVAYRRQTLRN